MCHQWKNYYQIVDNLWYGWYGLKKELVQEQKLGMHKQVIRAQGKYCCYVEITLSCHTLPDAYWICQEIFIWTKEDLYLRWNERYFQAYFENFTYF